MREKKGEITMKRFTVALVLLLLVLPGCGTGENSRASDQKAVEDQDYKVNGIQ